MTTLKSALAVSVATASQLSDAYHVRYLAFTERGDDRYANHDSQSMTDQLDERPGTFLLVGTTTSGEVAGSLRLVERQSGPFICDELYHWERIGALLSVEIEPAKCQTVLIDRGAVRPAFRGAALFSMMVEYGMNLARSRQLRMAVVVIRIEDTKLIDFFLKSGWRQLGAASGNGIDAMQLFRLL